MTSYKIIFDVNPLLKRDLSILKKNKKQIFHIKDKIEKYAQDPNKFISQTQKPAPKQEWLYRMRVGKCRIIFSKDDWNKILIIHRIGTRWDIYKKL